VRAYRETWRYQKALRKRKVWVEPLFAEAKEWHGMRRFRLRRLKKVNIEALMVAAGQNLKRLVGASRRGPRALPQAAALHFPEPPFSSSRCCARKGHRCVLRRRRRRFSTSWSVFDTNLMGTSPPRSTPCCLERLELHLLQGPGP
jgi:Transposase DDE domain